MLMRMARRKMTGAAVIGVAAEETGNGFLDGYRCCRWKANGSEE